MKNVIPFTKEIKFESNISEITSISLEENYNCTCDTIDGEFIISGDYKTHELSVNKETFEYKLPFSVDLTEKIIPDTLNFEITDFSYDILNDNILKINIEFKFDAEKNENRQELYNEVEEYLNESLEEKNDVMEYNDIEKEVVIDSEEEKVRIDVEEDTIIDAIKNNEGDEYMTYHVHIIKESETIESICALYNSNTTLLSEYNDLSEFKVGEKLIVVEEDE